MSAQSGIDSALTRLGSAIREMSVRVVDCRLPRWRPGLSASLNYSWLIGLLKYLVSLRRYQHLDPNRSHVICALVIGSLSEMILLGWRGVSP
jgi:hypothetical protein